MCSRGLLTAVMLVVTGGSEQPGEVSDGLAVLLAASAGCGSGLVPWGVEGAPPLTGSLSLAGPSELP